MTDTTRTDEPTSYHHGDLRRALIDAGLAILAEEDAAALTLRKVARRAGVSHTAPYRHFADKGALFAAIAEEGFHELRGRTEGVIGRFTPHPDRVVAEAGWAYIAFGLDKPDHLHVMFSGLIGDMADYDGLLDAAIASLTTLGRAVAIAQASGHVGPGDPFDLARTMWAMIHGITVLLIENKLPMIDCNDRVAAEAAARQMMGVFIAGLKEGWPQ